MLDPKSKLDLPARYDGAGFRKKRNAGVVTPERFGVGGNGNQGEQWRQQGGQQAA
jgi:hypothetical protein